MIESFRHKGLKELYQTGNSPRLDSRQLQKLRLILFRLDTAQEIDDMHFPGSGLHAIKGDLKDFYAVKVMANWRLIFRFDSGEVHDVDLLDYH